MRFVSCDYNKETNQAIVKIEHDGKVYVGTAKPAKEDMNYASEFTGCTIAEQKALLLVHRDRLRKARTEYEGCKKMLTQAKQCKKYNSSSSTAMIIEHQLEVKKRTMENIEEEIEELKRFCQEYLIHKQRFYRYIDLVNTNKVLNQPEEDN